MKVLIVTNVYPSKEHLYHGIFVKEQEFAIKRIYPEVDIDVYYINGFKGKWQYIKSIWNVRKLINTGLYDLVHIHYGFSGLYLFSPFVRHIPTLTTFHGSDIQPKGGNGFISVLVSRFVACKSDAAIVLNAEMENMVKPYCRNIYLIPCAVNVNTFCPLDQRKSHNLIQIVFPSTRERKVKNYPLFCKILEILKDKYGVNAQSRELKDMSRQDIAQLFASSDLLLMTSYSEGSPQAVKEAMSCNLPCVSTPVGDVDILLHGVKDCYVSKSFDPEELAYLAFKSINRGGNGIEGRQKIKILELDEDHVANKIYSIYKKLI